VDEPTLECAPLAVANEVAGWPHIKFLLNGPLRFRINDVGLLSPFVVIRARAGDDYVRRMSLAELSATAAQLERRDAAALKALTSSATTEEVLRALLKGVVSLSRPRRTQVGERSGTRRNASHALADSTLERLLQAVARDAELLRELTLLLGDKADPAFRKFQADLESIVRRSG
jgi:hypothetical protein